MHTYDASTSKAAKASANALIDRLTVGKHEQNRLLEQVAALHIQDKLVPPTRMAFNVNALGKVFISYDGPNGDLIEVHPHALGQMCSVCGLRKLYANFLLDETRKEEPNWSQWGPALFQKNIETLFGQRRYVDRRGAPTKFLHRLVDVRGKKQLRGFMSRNFGRHLASLPLLEAFIAACQLVDAQPLEASVSDVFFSLRCFMPHVFEPVPNELVAYGVNWSNSDFGAGRMKVSLSVMRAKGGKPIILEDSLSKTHLGSIIQESDLEVSDDTAKKEISALSSAIRDVVTKQLEPASIERLNTLIAKAAAEDISWAKLKSITGSVLGKSDLEELQKLFDDEVEDLPPVGGDKPTQWWASNAISRMAAKAESSDRSEELKELAGKLLNA